MPIFRTFVSNRRMIHSSVYDIYSYTYKVTCGGEALYDETIQPGTEIPLDPSVDGNKIMESVANEQADEESTEAGTASLN